MGTLHTSYRVISKQEPQPNFSPSTYTHEPWRIARPVKITEYARSKNPLTREDWIEEEREKLKQRIYEGYLQPPLDAAYEIKATKKILQVWMKLRDPPREEKPFVMDSTTVRAAFGIVDHDHDKITISEWIRAENYCVADDDIQRVLLPDLKHQHNRDKLATLLSCNTPPPSKDPVFKGSRKVVVEGQRRIFHRHRDM